jgi:RNA polymerase-binding protein DksA
MSKPATRERFREELHAMRKRLDDRAPELRDEAFRGAAGQDTGDHSVAPIHPADLGNQEAEAAVNLELAANEAFIRQEIDDALARMDDGTFGVCEECRKPIDPGRLAAIPYARLCIQCAKRDQY